MCTIYGYNDNINGIINECVGFFCKSQSQSPTDGTVLQLPHKQLLFHFHTLYISITLTIITNTQRLPPSTPLLARAYHPETIPLYPLYIIPYTLFIITHQLRHYHHNLINWSVCGVIGLKNTFSVRLRVLRNGARYTAAFCLYWTIAEILYFLIYQTERSQSPEEQLQPPSSDKVPLYATFALTMGVRGFIDVGVWMVNQDVVTTYHRWWHGQASIKEPLELNRQLRREVLTYSTQGICASVDSVAQIPFKDGAPGIHLYPQTLDPPVGFDSQAAKRELLRPAGEEDAAPVPFLDFAPLVFRYLRYKFGINEEAYKLSIKGDTDAMIEKYTEGRSGSFFYFSEDGEYIVKTLSKSEATFLLQSFLPAYVDYMSKNPHSMITKFLGYTTTHHAIEFNHTTISSLLICYLSVSPIIVSIPSSYIH
jgi:hypothetical protein